MKIRVILNIWSKLQVILCKTLLLLKAQLKTKNNYV